MADHLHQRLSVRAVADGTTEATSLDRRHRILSLLVLPTAVGVARNSASRKPVFLRVHRPTRSGQSIAEGGRSPSAADKKNPPERVVTSAGHGCAVLSALKLASGYAVMSLRPNLGHVSVLGVNRLSLYPARH
jgi:hypothetical protein